MHEQRPADCQNCQKPCTVFYTQISQNSTIKVAMCADCPHAKKLEEDKSLGPLSQILGMLAPVPVAGTFHACPKCGATWAYFQKNHLLGCSACYETHAANVAQLLPRIQPGSKHMGKIPPQFHRIHARERLAALRKELPRAIAAENYERAAQLRDEIKSLENHFSAGETSGI